MGVFFLRLIFTAVWGSKSLLRGRNLLVKAEFMPWTITIRGCIISLLWDELCLAEYVHFHLLLINLDLGSTSYFPVAEILGIKSILSGV
jgi:hypothetical protein